MVPSPPRAYRSRMVYARLTQAAIAADELALPVVKAAAHAVARWVESSPCMPSGFWRELSVRSLRPGGVQLKLILQLPSTHGAAAESASGSGTVARSGDAAAGDVAEACTAETGCDALLHAYPSWSHERQAFEAYIRQTLGEETSACFQLARGTARPPKHAPCVALFGALRRLERHGASEYLVGPETLSQVNPATASELVDLVSRWLGLTHHTSAPPSPSPAPSMDGATATAARVAATAAAAAATSAATSILVTGRDINLFGAGLLGRTSHTLLAVTHCPCAYDDMLANIERLGDAANGRIHARWCPKGGQTAALLREVGCGGKQSVAAIAATDAGREASVSVNEATKGATESMAGGAKSSGGGAESSAGATETAPPLLRGAPTVAIATAGRKGLGRDVCAALRSALPLRALVYVSCCESTLASDLSILLAGSDGFVVADGKRFDHFAGTP